MTKYKLRKDTPMTKINSVFELTDNEFYLCHETGEVFPIEHVEGKPDWFNKITPIEWEENDFAVVLSVVGDKIKDYRKNKTSIFQVKEISIQEDEIWLRPTKQEPSGIEERGCRKANYQEIIEYFREELKKRNFRNGTKFIALRDTTSMDYGSDTINPIGSFSKYLKENAAFYDVRDITYNEKTDTLTCWGAGVFVVYEKGEWVKSPSKVLETKLGSNNVNILIHHNKIVIPSKETEITLDQINAIYNLFGKRNKTVVGKEWEITCDINVRFIRIGCSAENNLFSLQDITYILNTMKSL